MLTIPLYIKSCSDVVLLKEFEGQATGMFYFLYNNAELLDDKSTKQELIQKFPLFDISMIDSCIIEVKMKLSQHKTSIAKKEKQIISIQKQLDNGDFISNREKRYKFKLTKKLAKLKRTKYNNVCFGGKALLQEITRLSQTSSNPELLTKKKDEFKHKRKLGVYLVGRACDKGNRKINFDLTNNKIVFKPSSKVHIDIEFVGVKGKRQLELLKKLQLLSLNKQIPLTIKLFSDRICISYDELVVNGFDFKEFDCKKEQKVCATKDEQKDIFKKFKKEQEERMLVGKIENRYIAVDLNPFDVGLCIADKKDDGEIEFLYKEVIFLNKLNKKLGVSSGHKKQKKQNNKRKHEIKEVWKYIFGLAVHYHCFNFVVEKLEFSKGETVNDKDKVSNRKIKNCWHLTLTKGLIEKWCNIVGLKKVEVIAAYSSFVGNLVYQEFDCIASSMELMRRGVNKYIAGSEICPSVSRINQESMTYLLGENIDICGKETFVSLHKKVQDAKLRYRNKSTKFLEGLEDKVLKSNKSKVKRCFASLL